MREVAPTGGEADIHVTIAFSQASAVDGGAETRGVHLPVEMGGLGLG